MTEIELWKLKKVYATGRQQAPPAVCDVDLKIASGEFFFLLGPSGCGKTTLLRMIAGLIEPTAGKIIFNGRDVTDLPVERRNTAMVFQNYALWPHMTVDQNVQFGPRMQGAGRKERRQRAGENLARVQMADYARRKPNQLSGGQQQRVALARALAAQPRCLLLDEPLSNLDARLRLHMRTELRRLVKAAGNTAVYVTHDQKEALSMADRIAVMDAGQIAQIGTPDEVYNRPRSRFVADFLGEANFIDGKMAQPGDQAVVETPTGRVFAHGPDDRFAGDSVTCCVRPERVSITPIEPETRVVASGTTSALPAVIEATVYLGEMRQYLCRLSEETTWRVSQLAGAAAPLEEGQRVRLEFAPDDVTLLTG
jgi:iron(III) transport system ATP-binding protein